MFTGQRLMPPIRGAANHTAATDTPPLTVPANAIDNVFVFDPNEDRPSFGSRPGLYEFFPGQYGNGLPVQGMGTVTRGRTPSGYRRGTETSLPNSNGSAKPSPPIVGQVWELDTAWALSRVFYENVSPSGNVVYGPDTGPANQSVNAVALSPTGNVSYIASNYNDGSSHLVSRVTAISMLTNQVLWTRKIAQTGIDRFTNAIVAHNEWVFVCTNHVVRVYNANNGNAPVSGPQDFNMNGWSDEAIKAVFDTQGRLLVLFQGSSVGATLPSGVNVTSGKFARHFRAGVMRFIVRTQQQNAGGSPVLEQVPMGQILNSGATYFEANHGYTRFSEQFPTKPRGCLPTAIAATPDGGFVVTHTNTGWGPDGNNSSPHYFPPDGTGGYWNITKFDANGQFQWRNDTLSIIEPGDGGFQNDIPTTNTDLPSLIAVAVAADGTIYCGGRRNLPSADGRNAFCLDQNGLVRWAADLGSIVREGALAVLPTTQAPVFGGDNNASWTGSNGVQAHLWELRREDGGIRRTYSLGNVSALGVAASPNGNLVYVTDKV